MPRSRGSEKHRSNRSSDSPPPHLGALPHWDEIEYRLRARWTADRIVAWHSEQYPQVAQPTVRALKAFLRRKLLSWFVVELAIASFTPPRGHRIVVLDELAAVIQIVKFRLNKLLAMEHDTGGCTPEVRQNIELLLKMYHAYWTAQQATGGDSKPEPSDEDFSDPLSPFLTSGQARHLAQLKQDLDSGKIDLAQLYELANPMFETRQWREGERGFKGGHR
jgi:hypothetical protein